MVFSTHLRQKPSYFPLPSSLLGAKTKKCSSDGCRCCRPGRWPLYEVNVDVRSRSQIWETFLSLRCPLTLERIHNETISIELLFCLPPSLCRCKFSQFPYFRVFPSYGVCCGIGMDSRKNSRHMSLSYNYFLQVFGFLIYRCTLQEFHMKIPRRRSESHLQIAQFSFFFVSFLGSAVQLDVTEHRPENWKKWHDISAWI